MTHKNDCSSSNPSVTDLQYVFLDELSRGSKTGRHLRIRLQARGWNGKRLAFQRLIRRLKDAGLLVARRIPRDKDEYRGSQSLYELTETGWDAVIKARDSYEDSLISERTWSPTNRPLASKQLRSEKIL